MNDASLKDLVFRHYWAQRSFVQPEVDVYYAAGTEGATKRITDVDVLALRPHPDLYFERVLADCRTLKGQSPITRALWLRGLMHFLHARAGCVVLRLSQGIEPDHKLAASEMNILLLTEDDFRVYDRSIVPPAGTDHADVSARDVIVLRDSCQRYAGLQPLIAYVARDAWQERTFGDLIRHSIAALRKAASELDPAKTEHYALVCEAAAVLAIGVAECAGRLFHQYLHPEQKEVLAESLKVLLWGGREQYEFYQNVRQKLYEAKGSAPAELAPLELPEWNLFVQLIRNIVEQPARAFHVPWMLRRLAIDIHRGHSPLFSVERDDLIVLKFSMMLLSYACRAPGLPSAFEKELTGGLVRIQSRVAANDSGGQVDMSWPPRQR
ncbi:MAG: hypothetical protein HY682_04770 [Chloroflexi bacterium]|nr:hypothetical protein [Chloroflexota bacterium]